MIYPLTSSSDRRIDVRARLHRVFIAPYMSDAMRYFLELTPIWQVGDMIWLLPVGQLYVSEIHCIYERYSWIISGSDMRDHGNMLSFFDNLSVLSEFLIDFRDK